MMKNVDTSENVINTIEWFFGYGGNHAGIKRVLPNLRLIAACEIEAYALANMADKMEKGLLGSCPIWTDCKTFPREPFIDKRIDLFIASYPCQGFSLSGKRKGKEDERYLWPYCRDFIADVRPEWCFFENVEGHLTLGLSTVIADLLELGYTATFGIFSAEECIVGHSEAVTLDSGEIISIDIWESPPPSAKKGLYHGQRQ